MEIKKSHPPFPHGGCCHSGMDVIIVSTNNEKQEDFWQKRLKDLRGVICKNDAVVIAVTEDWPGGAGNGLGTLYSYFKAQEKAKFMYHIDLYEMQKQGASVAIYHTAGLGKRLFPLTASEFNNKSAVKLPGFIDKQLITVLESVILQTAQFAKHRIGRLSVFWGDQIFVPSKGSQDRPEHHIEILGQVQGKLSEIEKSHFNLERYGFLSISRMGEVKLLEKIDKPTLSNLVKTKKISSEDSGAISLGSFSLSSQMTFALLREFDQELERRKGKLDTDPHFWMPLTLDIDTYLLLMKKKGCNKREAKTYYRRMKTFKDKFLQLHSDADFFSVTDIGKGGFWWDYGSARSYYENILKLAKPGSEGQASRLFFQVDPKKSYTNTSRVIKDEDSCLINCNIRSGKIKNSILIGVNAKSIEADNCVIINSDFSSLKANRSLFYYVKEAVDVAYSVGTIRADTFLPKTGEHLKIYSHQDRDGKADWQRILPQNTLSYQEICERIQLES